jgi:glyoxylase-like metal-dependent hydrolase (beta-lactamase superfamily II)
MTSRSQLDVSVLPVARGQFRNYSYLGCDRTSGDAVLIDPAWELETIEAAVRAKAATVRAILLTHSHHDHVDLADTLAARMSCPVYMSEEEARFYEFACQNLRLLDSEAPLQAGTLSVIPLTTPGHTRGALSYWIEGNLFSGDTLFSEGCGMCFGRGADPNAMFDTMQKLKRIVSGETRVFPGHSYGTSPGQTFEWLRANNIYLMFEERSQFVSFRMRGKQTGLMAFR